MIEDKINPSYYRKKIEVTDFILEYDMGFAEGNIIKYVTRYKDKNGVEDLKKVDTRSNRRKMLKKAVPLINELFCDYNRLSSSGQEILDDLAKLFSLPTNKQVEEALKEALKW